MNPHHLKQIQLEFPLEKDPQPVAEEIVNNVDYSFLEHLREEQKTRIAALVNRCVERVDEILEM